MVNYRVPGGENLLDMEARVMPMLKDIVNIHEGDELLIVAHGGVNRIICSTPLAHRSPQYSISNKASAATISSTIILTAWQR
jgi:broad specificity phosphatase PhoE